MNFSNNGARKIFNGADMERIKCREHLIKSDVLFPPPPRPWVPTAPLEESRPSCIFSVMSYNVLSSSYATPKMYGYCPKEYLNWEVRGQNIMSEIFQYNADIICLQEVEMEQFDVFFLPNLQSMEYEGIFAPKSRALTMSELNRNLVDGCAIFWKIDKFSLDKSKLVEYKTLAVQDGADSSVMLNRVWSRDNVGRLAVLKTTAAAWTHGPPVDPNDIEQLIIVANTHLHWDPRFPDVKTIQSMMLTREIVAMVKSVRSSPERILKFSEIKVLLCGDFNSLMDSGVFQFLSTGQLPLSHSEFEGFDYINAIVNMMGGEYSDRITHPLNLSSACIPEIMPYTNYTYRFKAMIDYIFHSSSNMVCLGVYGPILQEWFDMFGVMGCPHPFVPSNHFPLIAAFQLTA
ncbi:CCR4-NOT transcription complex subunit 6-like [Cotesia typhae]|uniref:CCR4-NOT transcription complex subunit 6-like n=1 Tax=Cotesia typhae TaxID=2053667 RepID=UPI003D68052D